MHESVKDKVQEMGQKVRLRYYSCDCTTSRHFNQVNLKVGQGLASAIDKGEKATHATKEKLGMSLLQNLEHLHHFHLHRRGSKLC